MQNACTPLDRARSAAPDDGRRGTERKDGKAIARDARIDTQRGPGSRRQGDHDHRHGAHHRQLRHLGRRRHAARFHDVRQSPRSAEAKISAQEYRVAYDRAIQQYQRRLRHPFTNEEARQIGLDRSILQQLLSEAAVDDETHKLGLDLSDDALRQIITSNPNFRDKSGAFDPARFAGALRDLDMSERGFVSELRKQVLRQFIVAALATGVTAPKAESRAEADYQGQTRSVDYFVLPASAAGDIPAASDEALKTFLQRSQVELPRAEYRGMTILALEPDTLANPAEVSDADAEAAYQKLAGKDPKFGAPEKRDLQQILFPNQGDAEAAEAKLKAGASFDDLVKRGLKPRRHRHRRDDQGRHTRQGRGRRRLRPAARRRQRRAQEPVRSGHRPRQRRHPVHGQAIRRSRRRGEAAGLRLARGRQDPDPARQDRGPPGVGQIDPRRRQGGGLERANHRRGRRWGRDPKARRSICRTRPSCCAPPSLPTSASTRRR